MTKSVYVENHNSEIVRMFEQNGWSIIKNLSGLKDADLVCLDGGADVSPELYGEENTQSMNDMRSDVMSLGLICAATMLSKPVVGICRGSQILNVYHGGSMQQHVDGHTGASHTLLYKGEEYKVCSGHHQNSLVAKGWDSVLESEDGVTEVFISAKRGVMGMQSHPEWTPLGSDNQRLFFKLIEEIM